MPEDVKWVEQVLQGDHQAYAHIVNKYKNRIYALLLRMCRSPQDAQDWTQDTFIRAFRYLHTYQSTEKFSTWLYTVAVNHCHTQMKKQQKRSTSELNEKDLNDHQSPESILLNKETKTQILHAIDQLPEHYRLVICLRYIQDLSYKEMAQILDLPITTVQNHLSRARKRLRMQLQSSYREGGNVHEMLGY